MLCTLLHMLVKVGAQIAAARFFGVLTRAQLLYHTVLIFGPDAGSAEDIIGALASHYSIP